MDLSIIIPTHNRLTELKRLLNSILRLKLQNYEIIIIDNASDEQTQNYLQSFKKLHNNLVTLVFKTPTTNPGLSRGIGIHIASGKYIYCCDSDDELAPEFADCLKYALSTQLPIVQFCHQVIHLGDEKRNNIGVPYGGRFIPNKTVIYNSYNLHELKVWVQMWNKLIRRELFDGVKFYDCAHEDSKVMVQVLDSHPDVTVISKVGYIHYCDQTQSLQHVKRPADEAKHLNALRDVLQYHQFKTKFGRDWAENSNKRLKNVK